MQIGLINSLESVEISFKALRPRYGTGVTTTSVGAYGEKKHSYRNGVMTSQGDILEDVWVKAVELLAEKNGETALLEKLKEAQFSGCANHTEYLITREACRLYAYQMFDNKGWVEYVRFNKLVRPNVLANDKDIINVLPKCCKELCETTKQIISASYDDKIPCPICGKRTEYIGAYE